VAKFATEVVDTGGAPWLANISANFRKNSKWPPVLLSGAWGNMIHEKIWSKKSCDIVTLRFHFRGKNRLSCSSRRLWLWYKGSHERDFDAWVPPRWPRESRASRRARMCSYSPQRSLPRRRFSEINQS
jgi:hypothetical protein